MSVHLQSIDYQSLHTLLCFFLLIALCFHFLVIIFCSLALTLNLQSCLSIVTVVLQLFPLYFITDCLYNTYLLLTLLVYSHYLNFHFILPYLVWYLLWSFVILKLHRSFMLVLCNVLSPSIRRVTVFALRRSFYCQRQCKCSYVLMS